SVSIDGLWSEELEESMLLQKGFAQRGIAKGLGPSAGLSGERAGYVAGLCTGDGVLTQQIGAEKAGVEAVPCPYSVDGNDVERGDVGCAAELIDARSAAPTLDDDDGRLCGESLDRIVQIGALRHATHF